METAIKDTIQARILFTAQSLGSRVKTIKKAHAFIMVRQQHPFQILPTIYPHSRQSREAYKRARELNSRHILPISPGEVCDTLLEITKEYFPRKRNVIHPKTCITGSGITPETINNGPYSSRCRYNHMQYRIRISSWCRIQRGKLFVHFNGKSKLFVPPRGYEWRIAILNGLRTPALFRKGCSQTWLPVKADMFVNPKLKFYKKVVVDFSTLTKHIVCAKKYIQKYKPLARKLTQIGVLIRKENAIASGLCEAGVRNFIEMHGLDGNGAYTPLQILRLMPLPYSDSFLSIIRAAYLRQEDSLPEKNRISHDILYG